jgi:hypothetical protein
MKMSGSKIDVLGHKITLQKAMKEAHRNGYLIFCLNNNNNTRS